MATGTLVPLEEYLKTSYEPDCEYLDGELVERNVGTPKHAYLQILLAGYLTNRRKKWGITPLTDVRFRVRERRYRIPDLCIVQGPLPTGDVVMEPPLLWIEILSPEDRPLRVQNKVREVLDYGCPYVWVIDPETLENRLYTPHSDFVPDNDTLTIPGTEIAIPLRALEED